MRRGEGSGVDERMEGCRHGGGQSQGRQQQNRGTHFEDGEWAALGAKQRRRSLGGVGGLGGSPVAGGGAD